MSHPPTAIHHPRYQAVLATLRVDCLSGAYVHRLPSEPDLAKAYGVSRTTIRKAIATLVDEGILEPRHGSGTFIRPGSDRRRTIGLLLADSVVANPGDPYAQQLVHHLVLALAEAGWSLRLGRSIAEMGEVLAAEHETVASACVAAFFAADHVNDLDDLPLPVVLLDSEPVPGRHGIASDNRMGMEAAVAAAVGLGHRRIGHVHGLDYTLSARERLDTFRTAMADAGLPVEAGAIKRGFFDPGSGYAAMAAWAAAGDLPTAVICANDLMAIGAMHWLADQGLKPGREVSIVGFDDLACAALMRPALATIALDFRAHTRAVLAAVMDIHHPTVRRTPMHLVPRASLGPPP